MRDLPRGVTRSNGRYMSRVHVDGVRKYLGAYATPEEAGDVYQDFVSSLPANRRRIKWEPLDYRFWSAVAVSDGCWEWQGLLDQWGYGVIKRNGHAVKASRLSWELHNGSINQGLLVLHHCDNPKCVNPRHLFLGTDSDNAKDKAGKGRSVRGEQHWKARLTEQDVHGLRFALTCGATAKSMAAIYQISCRYVHDIESRRYWAHI